ncbi:MAG: crossover junction endodeoxyribonuclease RuvC [Chlorobiaceae bacterium]|nr:crossover junction endodeoxyribonuclease RuvC [Chlorobiaceae bacterium]
MVVVLGVDPGSLKTGYGVVCEDSSGFSVLTCGVIRLNSARSHAERIGRIYRELEKIINTTKPRRVALETVFLSKNAQSALKLGQVRGAVIALSMNSDLELHEYAPREVKSAVTGRGSASKEQVAFMVTRMLQVTERITSYDVTDALGLALCDLLRMGSRVTQDQPPGTLAGSKSWTGFVRAFPEMLVR